MTEVQLQRRAGGNVTAQLVSCPTIHLRMEVAVEKPAEASQRGGRQEVKQETGQGQQQRQHGGQAGGQGARGTGPLMRRTATTRFLILQPRRSQI